MGRRDICLIVYWENTDNKNANKTTAHTGVLCFHFLGGWRDTGQGYVPFPVRKVSQQSEPSVSCRYREKKVKYFQSSVPKVTLIWRREQAGAVLSKAWYFVLEKWRGAGETLFLVLVSLVNVSCCRRLLLISVLQILCMMAHPFLVLLFGMQGSEETHSEHIKQFWATRHFEIGWKIILTI